MMTRFNFGNSNCNGKSNVILIGYYLNDTEKGIFVKESDDHDAENKIVQDFLNKLVSFQAEHYAQLPDSVKNYFELVTNRLKNEKDLYVSEKTKLYDHKTFIKKIFKLNCIGFNSSRFDLPVLFRHFMELCDITKIKTIKKGTFFSHEIMRTFASETLRTIYLDVLLQNFAKYSMLTNPRGFSPMSFFRVFNISKTPLNAHRFPHFIHPYRNSINLNSLKH